jgi:hypothetical protein
MQILSGDCNAKSGNEDIFKPTFGIEILHRDSNDNGFRIVNCIYLIIKHSPVGEAYQISDTPEIPHNILKPKVHYLVDKCPPSVTILDGL